jgi:hypothetical protein
MLAEPTNDEDVAAVVKDDDSISFKKVEDPDNKPRSKPQG